MDITAKIVKICRRITEIEHTIADVNRNKAEDMRHELYTLEIELEQLQPATEIKTYKGVYQEKQPTVVIPIEPVISCDCSDKSQCWEPCGDLGKSEEHAKTINQCDGCRANLPLVNGVHKDGQMFGIGCTKHLYTKSN